MRKWLAQLFNRNSFSQSREGRRFLRKTRGLVFAQRIEPTALLLLGGTLLALGGLFGLMLLLNEVTNIFRPALIEEVVDARILTNVEDQPGCFVDLAVDPVSNDILALRDEGRDCREARSTSKATPIYRLHTRSKTWSTPNQPFSGEGRDGKSIVQAIGRPCPLDGAASCNEEESLWVLSKAGGLARWSEDSWQNWFAPNAFADRSGGLVHEDAIVAAARSPTRNALALVTADGSVGAYDANTANWISGSPDLPPQARIVDAAWFANRIWVATTKGLFEGPIPANMRPLRSLKFSRRLEGNILDLTISAAGLLTLHEQACAQNSKAACVVADLFGYDAGSRTTTRQTLVDERQRDPALQAGHIKFVAGLDDWLILAGTRGVAGYDVKRRAWRQFTPVADKVTVLEQRADGAVFFGGHSWVGVLDRKGLTGGAMAQFRYTGTKDSVVSIVFDDQGRGLATTRDGTLQRFNARGSTTHFQQPTARLQEPLKRVFASGDVVIYAGSNAAVVHNFISRQYRRVLLTGASAAIARAQMWTASDSYVFAFVESATPQVLVFPAERPEAAVSVKLSHKLVSLGPWRDGKATAVDTDGRLLILSPDSRSPKVVFENHRIAAPLKDVDALNNRVLLAGQFGLIDYNVDTRLARLALEEPLRAIARGPDQQLFAAHEDGRLFSLGSGSASTVATALTGRGPKLSPEAVEDVLAIGSGLWIAGRERKKTHVERYDVVRRRVDQRFAVSYGTRPARFIGSFQTQPVLWVGSRVFLGRRNVVRSSSNIESAWLDNAQIWTVRHENDGRYLHRLDLKSGKQRCWYRVSEAASGARFLADATTLRPDDSDAGVSGLAVVVSERGLDFYHHAMRRWYNAGLSTKTGKGEIALLNDRLYWRHQLNASDFRLLQIDTRSLVLPDSCDPRQAIVPPAAVETEIEVKRVALNPKTGTLAWLDKRGRINGPLISGSSRRPGAADTKAPAETEVLRATFNGKKLFLLGHRSAWLYDIDTHQWSRDSLGGSGPIEAAALLFTKKGVRATVTGTGVSQRIDFSIDKGLATAAKAPINLPARTPNASASTDADRLVDAFIWQGKWVFQWSDRLAVFDIGKRDWLHRKLSLSPPSKRWRAVDLNGRLGFVTHRRNLLAIASSQNISRSDLAFATYPLDDLLSTAVDESGALLRIHNDGSVSRCEPRRRPAQCRQIQRPPQQISVKDVMEAYGIGEKNTFVVLRPRLRTVSLIRNDREAWRAETKQRRVDQFLRRSWGAVMRLGSHVYRFRRGQRPQLISDRTQLISVDDNDRAWMLGEHLPQLITEHRLPSARDVFGLPREVEIRAVNIVDGTALMHDGTVFQSSQQLMRLPKHLDLRQIRSLGRYDKNVWIELDRQLMFFQLNPCTSSEDKAGEESEDGVGQIPDQSCVALQNIDLPQLDTPIASLWRTADDMPGLRLQNGGRLEFRDNLFFDGYEPSGPRAPSVPETIGDQLRARVASLPNGKDVLNPPRRLKLVDGRIVVEKLFGEAVIGKAGVVDAEKQERLPALDDRWLSWDRQRARFAIATFSGDTLRIRPHALFFADGSPIFVGQSDPLAVANRDNVLAANQFGVWRFSSPEMRLTGNIAVTAWRRAGGGDFIASPDGISNGAGERISTDGRHERPVKSHRIAIGRARLDQNWQRPGVRFIADTRYKTRVRSPLLTPAGFAWDRRHDVGWKSERIYVRSDYGVHPVFQAGQDEPTADILWSGQSLAAARRKSRTTKVALNNRPVFAGGQPIGFVGDRITAAAAFDETLIVSTALGLSIGPAEHGAKWRRQAQRGGRVVAGFQMTRLPNPTLWALDGSNALPWRPALRKFDRAAATSVDRLRRSDIAHIGPLSARRKDRRIQFSLSVREPMKGNIWTKPVTWNAVAFDFDTVHDIASNVNGLIVSTAAAVLFSPFRNPSLLQATAYAVEKDHEIAELRQMSNAALVLWKRAGCRLFGTKEPAECPQGATLLPRVEAVAGPLQATVDRLGASAFRLIGNNDTPNSVYWRPEDGRFSFDHLSEIATCNGLTVTRTSDGKDFLYPNQDLKLNQARRLETSPGSKHVRFLCLDTHGASNSKLDPALYRLLRASSTTNNYFAERFDRNGKSGLVKDADLVDRLREYNRRGRVSPHATTLAERKNFVIGTLNGEPTLRRLGDGDWEAVSYDGVHALIDRPSAFIFHGQRVWASTEDGWIPLTESANGRMHADLADLPLLTPLRSQCDLARLRWFGNKVAFDCRNGRAFLLDDLQSGGQEISRRILLRNNAAAGPITVRLDDGSPAHRATFKLSRQAVTFANGRFSFDLLRKAISKTDTLELLADDGLWQSDGLLMALDRLSRPSGLPNAVVRHTVDIAIAAPSGRICRKQSDTCPRYLGSFGIGETAPRQEFYFGVGGDFLSLIMDGNGRIHRNRLAHGRFQTDQAEHLPITIANANTDREKEVTARARYCAPTGIKGIVMVGNQTARERLSVRLDACGDRLQQPSQRAQISKACFTPNPEHAGQKAPTSCTRMLEGRAGFAPLDPNHGRLCLQQQARRYVFRTKCTAPYNRLGMLKLVVAGDRLMTIIDGRLARLHPATHPAFQ